MEFAELHKDFLQLAKEYAEAHARKLYRDRSNRTKSCWKDPVFRARISLASKLRFMNPEYRMRMLESLRRRCLGPESHAKMSLGQKRRWEDPEHRKTMTDLLKGMSQKPENRRRLSEANKRNWKILSIEQE